MKTKREKVYKAIEQLRALSHVYMKKRRELAQKVDLTEAQWRMLEEISDEGFMPSLFAAKSDLTKAAVSKILKQLQEQKLVEVSSSEKDGRVKEYQLTKRAAGKLEKLREHRRQAIDAIWMKTDEPLLDASLEFNEALIQRFLEYSVT